MQTLVKPLDIPVEFETARLLVRCPREGDGKVLVEAIRASLPALRAWPSSLSWSLAEPSEAGSEAACCKALDKWQRGEDLWMMVWDKESGELVGCSGLHEPNWAMARCVIGWWGHTPMLGRGLMREAVQGVLDFAFSACAMRRVSCVTDARNLRSRRLAEQAGMAAEGVLCAYYPDGDAIAYARIKS